MAFSIATTARITCSLWDFDRKHLEAKELKLPKIRKDEGPIPLKKKKRIFLSLNLTVYDFFKRQICDEFAETNTWVDVLLLRCVFIIPTSSIIVIRNVESKTNLLPSHRFSYLISAQNSAKISLTFSGTTAKIFLSRPLSKWLTNGSRHLDSWLKINYESTPGGWPGAKCKNKLCWGK